jgi:hypothetical protein
MREARCRSRTGVEGLISHLKHDHRMMRNYLSGSAGDQINTLLATAAYNIKKWMRLKREEVMGLIFDCFPGHIFWSWQISNSMEVSKTRINKD